MLDKCLIFLALREIRFLNFGWLGTENPRVGSSILPQATRIS